MIEVKNLKFAYDSKVIFEDISFKLDAAEILFITGDNGSGKTTLLKNLARELKPSAGKIDYCNNFFYLPAEGNGLFLDLPALPQMEFWANLYQRDSQSVKEVLYGWGLKDPYLLEKIPVKKFSTGMKRKLALARGSLSRADVFILDEPCNGLDEKSTAYFRNWCRQENSERRAIFIVVSHDKNLLVDFKYQTLKIGKN